MEVDKGAVIIDHLIIIDGLIGSDGDRDVRIVLSSVGTWQFLEQVITIGGCHVVIGID